MTLSSYVYASGCPISMSQSDMGRCNKNPKKLLRKVVMRYYVYSRRPHPERLPPSSHLSQSFASLHLHGFPYPIINRDMLHGLPSVTAIPLFKKSYQNISAVYVNQNAHQDTVIILLSTPVLLIPSLLSTMRMQVSTKKPIICDMKKQPV